jgi:hypothetical protein
MKKIYLLIVVFMVQFSSPAHSQVEAVAAPIASGASIASVVGNIEQSISNLIEDLDNVISARSFQLRLELMFLLNEVENKGNSLIGKTFGELNNSQQLFFENTRKSISDIESMMNQGLDDIDQMITHAEQIVAQVPFTEEEPRIRSFGPLYLKSIESSGTVKLAFKGSFLNHGEARFEMAGEFCETISQTDSLLEFKCKNEPFVAFDDVNYITGTLLIQKEIGFFEGLFGKKAEFKQYTTSVVVVPAKLGTYEIEATVNTQNVQYANRDGRWGHVNPHCRSRRSSTTNFGPQGAGWKIDVNSIRTRFTNERRGSRRVINSSENGFQVEAVARNSGNCVFGSGDARGASQGVATWREYKVDPATQVQVISSGEVEWGKDIAVDLPTNLRGFKVIVRQIDGNEAILITADDKNWFSVTRDGQSTALVVSPKSLKEALSI